MQTETRRLSRKAGLPPGELVHVGEQYAQSVTLRITEYDTEDCTESVITNIRDLPDSFSTDKVVWLHLTGLHDPQWLVALGERFSIHPLVLEDILNTLQRPKFEESDSYLFLTFKRVFWNNHGNIHPELRQFSMVLCDNVLITFQESDEPVFAPLMERIHKKKGRIRSYGADYLAYAAIDLLLDQYFMVLEQVGEELDRIEDSLTGSPTDAVLFRAHSLKRQLLILRRTIWPVREILSHITRADNDWFKKDTLPYLRDLYDHAVQIIETLESQRDVASGLLDLYLSSLSNKMNSIMQVLTIIATIFIPLTFIAGIYGMNFEYMPELKWQSGYHGVLGIMGVLALLMLWGFHRKRWI